MRPQEEGWRLGRKLSLWRGCLICLCWQPSAVLGRVPSEATQAGFWTPHPKSTCHPCSKFSEICFVVRDCFGYFLIAVISPPNSSQVLSTTSSTQPQAPSLFRKQITMKRRSTQTPHNTKMGTKLDKRKTGKTKKDQTVWYDTKSLQKCHGVCFVVAVYSWVWCLPELWLILSVRRHWRK